MVKIGELVELLKHNVCNWAFDLSETGIMSHTVENDSTTDSRPKHEFDIIFTGLDMQKDCFRVSVESLDYDSTVKEKNFVYRKRCESRIISETSACSFEDRCKQYEHMHFTMKSSSCENGLWKAIYVKESLERVEIQNMYPII